MKYHFKEGDTVSHKYNSELKMTVTKIVKQYRKVPTRDRDRDEEGKLVLVEKEFLIGIECGWWENEKTFKREKFHSNMLVFLNKI